MADLGPVGTKIKQKLVAALQPSELEVIDESHLHAGHAGAHAQGESHFRVRIMAAALNGLTRVGQHRRVNDILSEELKTRVHALAIEVKRA
jgi:BolA family transcriptional regulator, general stress-responsive regulator